MEKIRLDLSETISFCVNLDSKIHETMSRDFIFVEDIISPEKIHLSDISLDSVAMLFLSESNKDALAQLTSFSEQGNPVAERLRKKIKFLFKV